MTKKEIEILISILNSLKVTALKLGDAQMLRQIQIDEKDAYEILRNLKKEDLCSKE